jgi:hypothetical protein
MGCSIATKVPTDDVDPDDREDERSEETRQAISQPAPGSNAEASGRTPWSLG